MIKKLMTLVLVIIIAFTLNKLNIRICLFFNIFGIPCVGCGLTRAFKLIINGNIMESFKYSVIPIPLLILIILYTYFYFKNSNELKMYINKNKMKLIIAFVLFTIFVWFINLNNELLY